MKTIVASDLHAGIDSAWLTPDNCTRFEQWCSTLQCETLILDGDTFDTWYCPHNQVPPTLVELMDLPIPSRALAALRALPQSIEVLYVRGNHDCTMTQALLASVLPRALWLGDSYNYAGLYVAHGSELAIFCAADPATLDCLPLGYFVTRLAATAEAKSGGHVPRRQEIVAGLIAAGQDHAGLPGALLRAVAAHAGVGPEEPILMPADLWNGTPTTVKALEAVYRNLVLRWDAANGAVAVPIGIAAEIGHLEGSAGIAFAGGARTVVFGHTHTPVLRQLPFGRVYANGGCMCGPATSWIVIDEGAEQQVGLWLDNKAWRTIGLTALAGQR
jgi:UDP-2,3-diacylglucosamine pyrophosphatase LpxH